MDTLKYFSALVFKMKNGWGHWIIKGGGQTSRGQPYYLLLVEMSCFIAYSHIISIPNNGILL